MFSVPFNQKKEMFGIYEKYKDQISEVYFPAPPNLIKSCRMIPWGEENEKLMFELITFLKQKNILSNMLMNSINDDNIYDLKKLSEIMFYIKKLHEFGLDVITVANPILFKCIKDNIPDMNVGLSIVSNIYSINQIRTYYDIGLYELCIPPLMSRSKDYILEIKKDMPDLKIKMMVNCFCNPHCVAFMHHHINTGNYNKNNDDFYFKYVCNQGYINPLTKNFILPNEIDHYDYIDIFKISGREFPCENIDFILDKYTTRNSNGYNLLSLLDGFKLKKSKLISSYYLKEIRNMDKIQNCNYKCNENNCNYCDEILEKYFDYEMGE